MSPKTAVTLNALALYAISGILSVAFYWQLDHGELPCPLCLLQRVGFAALAVGPILAIRNGPKPQYLGLSIIAALVGAGVAARQMLLHIMPGDPGYGTTLLGLHFYTWAFVCFVAAILDLDRLTARKMLEQGRLGIGFSSSKKIHIAVHKNNRPDAYRLYVEPSLFKNRQMTFDFKFFSRQNQYILFFRGSAIAIQNNMPDHRAVIRERK